MVLVVRTEPRRLRSAFSFSVSGMGHASILAWVALGSILPKTAPPSLYEQEIRPNVHKIIWYNLRERLPDIAPSKKPRDPRPPRARVKLQQNLTAGTIDTSQPPQLIWSPAPVVEVKQMLPSVNVIALAPPARPLRTFTALGTPARIDSPTPPLPDAPLIAEQRKFITVPLPPPARPQPRAFTPPAQTRTPAAVPALAAPELTIATNQPPVAANVFLPPMQPARRTFIPPAEAQHAPSPQPVNLPVGPEIQTKTAPSDGVFPEAAMARAVRPFVAPAVSPATSVQPSLVADAPTAVAANRLSEASLAIVGLFPKREAEIPLPRASQQPGFSAGPQLRADGGDAHPDRTQLVVPGLLANNAAGNQPEPALIASVQPPTSVQNLAAAARSIRVVSGDPLPASVTARTVPPPDPRLDGRMVYTIAIQMPNVSSYSGSWRVWFAERLVLPGQTPDLKPPLPIRKVDPKYIASAAADRVEGKVRLAAIIRRDGRIDSVELLEHLDTRLDQSAQEALAKWEFEPALRNGVAIDVDAIFDIPFRLSPRLPK